MWVMWVEKHQYRPMRTGIPHLDSGDFGFGNRQNYCPLGFKPITHKYTLYSLGVGVGPPKVAEILNPLASQLTVFGPQERERVY